MGTEIIFCGDPHGQLRHVVAAAHMLMPQAVILLGDIEPSRPLHLELESIREIVWWIVGNHDTDRQSSWDNLVGSELAHRRLDGRVETLPDGTRIAGLGGVFRAEIWSPPEEARHGNYGDWLKTLPFGWEKRPSMFERQRLKHRSSIFPDDYLRLARQQADILVTHEAGSSHPHGFEAIDELASAMGVHTAFHAHHHAGARGKC